MPSGDWDNPQPCTAPPPAEVDAVAALNQLRNRIPQLICALELVHGETPGLLVDVLTGDLPRERWLALATLCEGPARIMADLAQLCREQADRRQIEGQPD